jgi:hypothetical protein
MTTRAHVRVTGPEPDVFPLTTLAALRNHDILQKVSPKDTRRMKVKRNRVSRSRVSGPRVSGLCRVTRPPQNLKDLDYKGHALGDPLH